MNTAIPNRINKTPITIIKILKILLKPNVDSGREELVFTDVLWGFVLLDDDVVVVVVPLLVVETALDVVGDVVGDVVLVVILPVPIDVVALAVLPVTFVALEIVPLLGLVAYIDKGMANTAKNKKATINFLEFFNMNKPPKIILSI